MVATDRGQLVLVGAVVIAFIFVGIVLVFNGVVFTESVGDQGTVTDTREGGSVGISMERNIADTAHSANTAQKYSDSDDAAGELETRIGNASAPVGIMEAESGGTFASVSFEEYDDDTGEGYRVYQNETAEFTSDDIGVGEQEDWVITENETTIDRFEIRVDPSQSSGTADLVTVDNLDPDPEEPLDSVTDTLSIDASGANVTLSGAVTGDCADIQPGDDDLVVIQITRGFVQDQPDCKISFPGNETGSNGLGFQDGDQVSGTFDLTLETEPEGTLVDEYLVQPGVTEDPTQPNLSEIVWSAEYRIVYDSGQVDSLFEEEVEHYG